MINEMTSRQRVLAALTGEPVDHIPHCELIVDPLVALRSFSWADKLRAVAGTFGRLGTNGLYRDLTLVIKAAKGGLEQGAFLSAPEMKAVLRIWGALEPGLSRHLGKDNISFWGASGCFDHFLPYVLNPAQRDKGLSADGIIKTRDDLDKLAFADIDEVVQIAEEFLANKGDFAACPIIFLGIDPCWHSMGFETFSMALIDDPEFVGEVMDRICGWYARCAEEMCKLDFDFIWGADDIAYHSSPLFSPKTYREVLLPHTRKVAEKITKPWIYHSDGNLLPILDDLLSQGMNAIHPLEPGSMDLEEMKQNYGGQITLVGNIDLVKLEAGTEEEVIQDVWEKIKILGPGYRYILSSSNSITENVKPQNLRAMMSALEKYGKYPL